MATDYILFIHGVNTRQEQSFRQAAQTLFTRIESSIKDSARVLKPVYLFWGDIGKRGTNSLLKGLEASSTWNQFWFQGFRTEQILPEIRQMLQNIRTGFCGLGSESSQNFGIPIASIHMMGSPITLFSLINLNDGHNFDFTSSLKAMLESLYSRTNGKPLPWRNYAHPNDPIAYPLEGVMPLFLNEDSNKVQIEDIMTASNPLMQPFSQSLLPLVNGGKAHGSYWTSQKVAKTIAEVIASTRSYPVLSSSLKAEKVNL